MCEGRFAGVDWASQEHAACVVDADGRIVEGRRYRHDERGMRALCDGLVELGVLLVAVERPDGLLIERLLDAGLHVIAVHPNQVAAMRPRFSAAGGKSDSFDAFVLAELARTDSHRFRVLVPDSDADQGAARADPRPRGPRRARASRWPTSCAPSWSASGPAPRRSSPTSTARSRWRSSSATQPRPTRAASASSAWNASWPATTTADASPARELLDAAARRRRRPRRHARDRGPPPDRARASSPRWNRSSPGSRELTSEIRAAPARPPRRRRSSARCSATPRPRSAPPRSSPRSATAATATPPRPRSPPTAAKPPSPSNPASPSAPASAGPATTASETRSPPSPTPAATTTPGPPTSTTAPAPAAAATPTPSASSAAPGAASSGASGTTTPPTTPPNTAPSNNSSPPGVDTGSLIVTTPRGRDRPVRPFRRGTLRVRGKRAGCGAVDARGSGRPDGGLLAPIGGWYGRIGPHSERGMDFRLLGPLEVVDDGDRSLALGGAKQRALLAVLLLHANDVVSTERLVDEVWGESPPATVAKSIQVYVSQPAQGARRGPAGDPRARLPSARRAVRARPGVLRALVARGGGAEPATAAAKLREALALWRGPPLADFAYEPFAQRAEIARLEELRARARSRSGSTPTSRRAPRRARRRARGAGRRAPAARAAARAADARALPLRPPGGGARGLPGRATGAGRGARDRAGPRRCASSHQAILAPGPGARPRAASPRCAAEATPRGGVRRARRASSPSSSPASTTRSPAAGGLFLLVGEPGIGKSRLADELMRHARGTRTRACSSAAAGRRAVRRRTGPGCRRCARYVRDTRAPSAARAARRRAPRELAQILPELRELLPGPARAAAARVRGRPLPPLRRRRRSSCGERRRVQPLMLVPRRPPRGRRAVAAAAAVRRARARLGSRLLVVGAYRDVDPTARATRSPRRSPSSRASR